MDVDSIYCSPLRTSEKLASKIYGKREKELPSLRTWVPHTDSGRSGVLQKSYFTFKCCLIEGEVKRKTNKSL